MLSTFISRRPALRFVLLFGGGIFLAQSYPIQPGILSIVVILLALLSIATMALINRPILHDCLLTSLVIGLGMLLHSQQRVESAGTRLQPLEEDEQVQLRGTIDEEPIVRGNGIQLVVASKMVARRQEILQNDLRVLVHGRKSSFGSVLNDLHIGTTLRMTALLEEFPRPRNPGDFDYGRYLELNDIDGVVQVQDSLAITVEAKGRVTSLHALVGRFRNYLADIVDRLHGVDEANFLRGILLADRSNIAKDVNQAFIDTGTVHILSVSGSHVAVVVVVLYGILGLVRLPRKWIVVLSIVGILFYMVLTGSTPPVVRSAVMAIVLFSGLLLERKVDIYQSIAFSALALLLWNTNNLLDVGFQLSFAAVISIVYFYPILVKVLHRLSEKVEEIKLLDSALKLFAVSLAAQLGTLPFTIYYFERLSVISLLANLVVVPVVGINVMLGFATLAFAPISFWIAQCYAVLNEWLVSFLLGFVKAAASVPYAYVDTSRLGASFPLFYYAGLIGLINLGSRSAMKYTVIGILFLLNTTIYSSLLENHDRLLLVTMIDVGQGDAILLEFPNGRYALVDAGPISMTYDAGERLVAPVLKTRGIHRLDAVILSHPHSDHIGGIPYLMKHFSVRQLLEPSLRGETALYKSIRSMASEHSVPLHSFSSGDVISLDDQLRLYVLHPHAQKDSSGNLNNVSLVVKLVYGSTSMLLMGDAEREVEQKLVDRYRPILPSDILKAGHHGSSTSSSEEFLGAVHPTVALVSAGVHNKFKHPSPAVLREYSKRGIEFHRTDREGAIVVASDGTSWKQIRWREASF